MSRLYSGQGARLVVPVLESNSAVAIPVTSLPPEPEELLELLAAEAAPLAIWFDCAKAYLAIGREDAFRHMCTEATKEEVTTEVTRYFGQAPTYEQAQFFCALALLHIGKGRGGKEAAQKAEAFAHAAKAIQAARMLAPQEQIVALAQGHLHLAKNEVPQARQEFTRACSLADNGRTNIMGLLALALLHFQQKQYREALSLYRRALATFPGCPPEVRLGIAACHFQLGDVAGAGGAYERVLALDPDNPDALMGLAVIKFSSSNVQQGMADGLRLLTRAFEIDPGNVGTQLLLGHFCLLRGEYHKVEVLARAALEGSEVESVQAVAHCLLARTLHAQDQLPAAAQHYTAASQKDPGAALPHYGLAQAFLQQGSALNATTELQLALKAAPTMVDALKVLGTLVGDDASKVAAALGYMKAAVTKAEDDPGVWEVLGELSAAAGDHAGSLSAFQKALATHRQRAEAADGGVNGGPLGSQEAAGDAGGGARPPGPSPGPRLLNNTAVLCYRAGQLEQAAALLVEARAAAAPGSGHDALPAPHMAALAYNIARVQEASGQLQQAEEGYKALLAEDPGNLDCLLRLGCLARTRGATQLALEWGRKALAAHPGHGDALALMSQLFTERRDWQHADEVVKEMMGASKAGGKDGPATDPYAFLAYGNLLLALAPSDRRRPDDARRAENSLFKGLEAFRAVLKAEPRNAFAANGIGAVLAELGRLDEADEVFAEVQEAVAASNGLLSIPDVFINRANVALAKQEYVTAQRLYSTAMLKLGDTKKSQVLLYLARALYDSDHLGPAKACLMKAIHIAPTDHKLRFNAALTMQEHAVRLLRKKRAPGDPGAVEEIEAARGELANAQKYFDHLARLTARVTRLDDAKLRMHVSFCEKERDKSEVLLEQARRGAQIAAEHRREAELQRRLSMERRDMAALQKAAAVRAEAEKREAAAQAALEKQERLKQQWVLQRAEAGEVDAGGAEGRGKGSRKGGAKGGKKGGKGGARSLAADDEDASEEEGQGPGGGADGRLTPGPGNEPAPGAAIGKDQLFGSDSDDDAAAAAAMEKEMMEQAGLGSDDGGAGLEDDDVAPGAGGAGRLRKRALEGSPPGDDAAGLPGLGGEDDSGDEFLRDFEDPLPTAFGAAAVGQEGSGAVTGGDGNDGGPAAKRQRRGVALEDSDDPFEEAAGQAVVDGVGGAPSEPDPFMDEE